LQLAAEQVFAPGQLQLLVANAVSDSLRSIGRF